MCGDVSSRRGESAAQIVGGHRVQDDGRRILPARNRRRTKVSGAIPTIELLNVPLPRLAGSGFNADRAAAVADGCRRPFAAVKNSGQGRVGCAGWWMCHGWEE